MCVSHDCQKVYTFLLIYSSMDKLWSFQSFPFQKKKKNLNFAGSTRKIKVINITSPRFFFTDTRKHLRFYSNDISKSAVATGLLKKIKIAKIDLKKVIKPNFFALLSRYNGPIFYE